MEFITEDVAKELNLTPEQIAGLQPKFNDYLSEQKQEWDGKANENAEAILSGAAKYAMDKLGIKEERQQGEKYGDYLARISEQAVSSKKSEYERLKNEYDQKLKDFKGDTATKEELENAKRKLDEAQQQLANIDELKEKAGLYEETQKTLSELKKQAAFGNVKPAFSKDANPFEVDARWKEFQKTVEEKYNIELVDGEYLAIDKENKHKQVKLSELVEKNESLKSIMGERKVPGMGASGSSFKVEGLDVDIPEEAKTNTAKRTEIIKEIITKEGISLTSPEYSKRFAELNKQITKK